MLPRTLSKWFSTDSLTLWVYMQADEKQVCRLGGWLADCRQVCMMSWAGSEEDHTDRDVLETQGREKHLEVSSSTAAAGTCNNTLFRHWEYKTETLFWIFNCFSETSVWLWLQPGIWDHQRWLCQHAAVETTEHEETQGDVLIRFFLY